jgi:nicotinamidase-related amidase
MKGNDLATFRIAPGEAAVLEIDMQERLTAVMDPGWYRAVEDNVLRVLRAAEVFWMPVLATEQYPKGLGPTNPRVAGALEGVEMPEKLSFSCCGEPRFLELLEEAGRKKIVVVGMETQVCVYQTVLDLLEKGYAVFVPRDAVISRTRENWEVGLALMREAGAIITSTETLLFQLLQKAGTPEFKALQPLFK